MAAGHNDPRPGRGFRSSGLRPWFAWKLQLALFASLIALGHGFGVGTDPSENTNLMRKNLTAEDFKFDLSTVTLRSVNPRKIGGGNDGAIAFLNTRPRLLGYGVSQSRVQLLPCGVNTPHVHPRGTELLYVIKGNVTAGFVEENGNRVLINHLTDFQTTFFPQGLLHWYQNTGCTTAEITAVFNFEDPGTSTAAVALSRLPEDVLRAAFNIGKTTAAHITKHVNETIAANYFQHGSPECLAKCGLKRRL